MIGLDLILRLVKGTPLTYSELDGNFLSIRDNTLRTVVAVVGSVAVSTLRAVAMTPSGLVHADFETPGHAGKVLGVCLDPGAPGQQVRVATNGLISFTAVTQGDLLFLGTDGALTSTVPTTGFSQEIATAISASQIAIDLGTPIILA